MPRDTGGVPAIVIRERGFPGWRVEWGTVPGAREIAGFCGPYARIRALAYAAEEYDLWEEAADNERVIPLWGDARELSGLVRVITGRARR